MNVLIAGGTGFIGVPLCRSLVDHGHTALVLTRTPGRRPPQPGPASERAQGGPGLQDVAWEPQALERAVAGADGVINLAGESIAATRWSRRQKQRIRESRLAATRRLIEAMGRATPRPAVLVNASAIGYYGARGDEELGETDPAGGGFLAQTCAAWEAEAQRAEALGVRVVRLRIGVVLGAGGGALAKMVPPFQWFVGGPLGSGRQWMSWIHREDVIRLIEWALARPDCSGAVNATAPTPVRMRELCAALGRALHRPSWAPVPAFALRLMLGEMADLLLTGQRVLPRVALRAGFTFRFPDVEQALRSCVAVAQTALLGLTLWLCASPSVFAQASRLRGPIQAQNVLLYLVSALVGLLIGLVLYRYSQQTSQVQYRRGEAGEATRRADVIQPKMIMPTILEQLKRLPGSAQQREQVARTVSDIVTQTLEGQVGSLKKELTERYEQVVEEKRRSEAVLQRKYQDTLQEKKQTTAVLESLAEGLVVINNKGEVVMMNPAAERLLAVNPQEQMGRPLLDHLHDSQLVSLVRGSGDDDREIVLSAKQEQTKRILRSSNAVVTDENGTTVGMVAVLSDVTRQREIEQLKSDFLSTVSHELRTPIVAMRHALSILTDQVAGPLTEEQQSFAAIVQRNLDRLNALINDLLDLSKLEAKKMALRLEPAAIGAVVQGVCDSLEPWAKTKAITISRRVADNLPEAIMDASRITQVLTNLVGNAIKFTPPQGRITVEAGLTGEGDAIQVSVTDTGLGIAKDDIPRLFSKFQQLGERTASDISGTGLGLVIAKEIVELHQGRIWADSELQTGARFIFSLPLKPPAG